ncbi:hypothetical protein HDU83_001549 [Entophlyctis luteolus]|nr:hypothetical protein HDU83_001549 [Entophlyctis luteolus]
MHGFVPLLADDEQACESEFFECVDFRPEISELNRQLPTVQPITTYLHFHQNQTEARNLPLETVIQIVSYITEDRKRDLYAALSVNRSWHKASVSKFWKNTYVNNTASWLQFEENLHDRFKKEQSFSEYSSIRTLKLCNVGVPINSNSWNTVMRSCKSLETLILDDICIEGGDLANRSEGERRRHSVIPCLSSTDSTKYQCNSEKYQYVACSMEKLTTLEITWSPLLHFDPLLRLVSQSPSLRTVKLAGLNSLSEADLCVILRFLPLLSDFSLGDLRSTRAPFSSTRGVGAYHGELMARTLTEACKHLASLHLHGLTSVRRLAFSGLLSAAVDSASNSSRLTALSLHESTSHIDDTALFATLSSPVLMGTLTFLAISEAHSLTNRTFIAAIRACAHSLRAIEIGPGLKLEDYALTAVPQFCTELVSFTCVGLPKCTDISTFVGYPFQKLETLILRNMPALAEGRELIVPSRKRSAWRILVDSVLAESSDSRMEWHAAPEEDDNETVFTDSLYDIDVPDVFDFGGQVDAATIQMETTAAQAGLVLYGMNEPAIIGCIGLKRLELVNSSSMKPETVVKIVKALSPVLERVVISMSMVGDTERVDLIDSFPGVIYAE